MELRTHTQHVGIDASAQVNNYQFTVKVDKKIFHLLSSPYKYTIQACVRELSTNAKDSHIAAGNSEVPRAIILTAPTDDYPFFEVEDFGTGMTLEMIHNMTSYGYSSKEAGERADDFNGVLGIGCKSPLAYGNSFNVTSYFDGTEHSMVFYKGDGGIPCAAHLLSAPSTRGNGVIVKIPVKASDLDIFDHSIVRTVLALDYPVIVRKYVKVCDELLACESDPVEIAALQQRLKPKTGFGPLRIQVNGSNSISLRLGSKPNGKGIPPATEYCRGDSVYLNKPAILAHMGGVLYPIDFDALAQFGNVIAPEKLNVLAAITNLPSVARVNGSADLARSAVVKSAYGNNILAVIPFDNGELMFAASREELDYSIKHTRDAILKKVDDIIDSIKGHYKESVEVATDPLTARQSIFHKTIELTYFLTGGILTSGNAFANQHSYALMRYLNEHLLKLVDVSKFGNQLPSHYHVDVCWAYEKQLGLKIGSLLSNDHHYVNWVNFSAVDRFGNRQKTLHDHVGALGMLTRLGSLSVAEYDTITADGIRFPIDSIAQDSVAYVFVDKKSHYGKNIAARLAAMASKNKTPQFSAILLIKGDKPISDEHRQQFLKSLGNPKHVYSSNDLGSDPVVAPMSAAERVTFLARLRRCIEMPTRDGALSGSGSGDISNNAFKTHVTGDDIVAAPEEYAVIIYSMSKHYAGVVTKDGKTLTTLPCEGHCDDFAAADIVGVRKISEMFGESLRWGSAAKYGVKHHLSNYESTVCNKFAHLFGIRKIIRLSITDFQTFNKHTGNRLKTVAQVMTDELLDRFKPAPLYVTVNTYAKLKAELNADFLQRRSSNHSLCRESAKELTVLYSTGHMINKMETQHYLMTGTSTYGTLDSIVAWYVAMLEHAKNELGNRGYYDNITRVTAQQLIEVVRFALATAKEQLTGKQVKALDLQVDKNVAELKELLQRMINCDIVKYVLGGNTYYEDILHYSIDGTNISVSALTKLLATMGETHE